MAVLFRRWTEAAIPLRIYKLKIASAKDFDEIYKNNTRQQPMPLPSTIFVMECDA